MGRSGRHRQTETPKRLRTALIAAAGLAAVALAAITVAVTGAGSSSAQMKARAAAADPPRPLDRASRDQDRTPIASPTPEPSDTPAPAPAAKKKRHTKILAHGTCDASYYGTDGGRTASGESIGPDDLTAAHRSLPIGSKVRVTNRNNDRSVIVRINDRGPFVAGRCLDLSSAAMQAVGGLASGVIPVKYEVLAKV
ncbi:septal ring lytic transglycosylase RlpA family protein [Actinoallomurus sp. NBC_01490]|uniref:septal ring lytic transglycosylase RlpA family protein n=1 Tax=Actinoallomurus sp. NBC_01490 TaxID=2903557 RepID=UPI002E309E76|nr:septal ring lytic transglycosylase RlpA family protein [Actinoallomurus sp. NBC_01490]